MKPVKIVIDEGIPFVKGILEPFAQVEHLPSNLIDHDRVKDADALIIRTRTRCNQKLLENSNIKFIATATIGFDHIDTNYCHRNHIAWSNAPGCNSGSVLQYLLSALFTLRAESIINFKNKNLGIIGVGHIGSKLEAAARMLGFNILLNDPPRERREGNSKFIDLETLLKKSDIVSLHVPLNLEGSDSTFHLINEKSLSYLKKDSIIINTSRGEVIDSIALNNALDQKKIRTAVLDVWEDEPVPYPSLISRVMLATPHIAGYSAEGKANATAMSIHSVSKFFNFPLTNWKPEISGSTGTLLYQPGINGISDLELLSWIILKTYSVRNDDILFRSQIENFETLRTSYTPRREFSAYTIQLPEANETTRRALLNLGFQVESI